jgi:cell division septum initiation protein DivIVA
MDSELILRQFEEIEERVKSLIAAYESLKATNLELKKRINRLEEELQTKVEAENSYTREKTLIRSKIDDLLSRLEGVE